MSKAIKRAAVQTMRRRVAAEQVEEKEDAALTFADVDPERESEASSADDDDFEAKARRFKQRLMQENMDAELEAQEHSKRRSAVAPLADAERVGVTDQHSAAELTARVEETIKVLTNFGVEREDGRTREEYLELLRHDLAELFEYNDFLMGCIVDLFPPQEAYEFLRKMDQERPVTIRTNTLKAKRRDLVQILTKKGAHVEPLEKWSKVGLQVFESNVPIAGTVEYLAGHYMLQSAVSFIPVLGLTPQEHERILDMSAAPGGKTTYIAQLMQNTGVLFANDVNEDRCKALNANIQRLGISNCIVTHYDGVGYERVARGFDRVLLDAPCTGTGVISRDKSIKTSKTLADVQRTSELQRRMILSAIDCVSAKSATGGIIVYSTCSFLVEENEAVVDYALRKRYVRVEPIEVGFGRPGLTKYRHHRFHPDVAMSLRFFPHVHNMDGFYVCRLRKYKDGPRDEDGAAAAEDAVAAAAEAAKVRKEKANSVKAKRAAKVAAAKATDAGNGRVSIPPPVSGKKRTNAKATKGKASKKVAKAAKRDADSA